MSRSFYFIALMAIVFLAFAAPKRAVAQGSCTNEPLDPDVAYAAEGVTLIGQVSLQTFGDTRASDMWGYVSPSGREYALVGLQNSFTFVEVTDPTNPVIIGQVAGPASCWRDIKVLGEYAYGVIDSSGLGMQIIDLHEIDDGIVTLSATSNVGGLFTSHNLAINTESGFAYPCISDMTPFRWGQTVLDLSNPIDPQLVGTFFGSENTNVRFHDAQVVNYTEGKYAGREIFFGFTERPNTGDAVWILDVTDKKNIFKVASVDYATAAYCHQGWLSKDRHYLFVDDELDEDDGLVDVTTTYVFDVQDLENPTLVRTFSSGLPSADHNLMVRGNLVYEANYASGLQVFDVKDIENITRVGYFDTYPENDVAATGPDGTGAWQVYTAMPSGVVMLSDRNRGLFLFDTSELDCGDGTVGPGELCDTGIAAGNPGACPTSCEVAECTVVELTNAGTCLAQCNVLSEITDPANDDACCPPGANASNDNDCPSVCGNDICEPTEDAVNCAVDCAPVCGNGTCEESETPANCPSDCPCTSQSECDDGDVCTFDQCIASACSIVQSRFGDTDHDGDVTLGDILCVLDGFSGSFLNCSFVDVDIAGCAADGDIDLSDILAVLDAFSGTSECCIGGRR